eukprot:12788266-Ditylum_brightwellii.AAC.1
MKIALISTVLFLTAPAPSFVVSTIHDNAAAKEEIMCNSTKAQENSLVINNNRHEGGNNDKHACSESRNLSLCLRLQQQWAKKKECKANQQGFQQNRTVSKNYTR